MKILQINTCLNFSASGRITAEIGDLLIKHGHESVIAYSRSLSSPGSSAIRIGSKKDILSHAVLTRLFDRHGFGSKRATEAFIDQIKEVNPDVVHLHNIHGYYLHIGVLFDYLKETGKPVVWTLHDCWPFTGHCSYFDSVNCFKWQSECYECPNLKGYPESWFSDSSAKNFRQKRVLFTGPDNMTLISPSEWMANHLRSSFLKNYPIKIINNGVDLNKFKPVNKDIARKKFDLTRGKIILGVANIWDKRKGLEDFIILRQMLDLNIGIVLVGLKPEQINGLPYGIKGLMRTESTEDLATLYSAADLFINPTYIDNFPTVNIEALASGTPVITYNTGGGKEIIDNKTGMVVEKGSIRILAESINFMLQNADPCMRVECRERAVRLYDKDQRYNDYIALYHKVLINNKI